MKLRHTIYLCTLVTLFLTLLTFSYNAPIYVLFLPALSTGYALIIKEVEPYITRPNYGTEIIILTLFHLVLLLVSIRYFTEYALIFACMFLGIMLTFPMESKVMK